MHMATKTKRWTLDELHSLPDDGNKYELVRGQLFVTPPPSAGHETILARLTAILVPYIMEQGLGMVFRPRAVMCFEGSEVEPDLAVRVEFEDWDNAPVPILVVEVHSGSTRRRDNLEKRQLYQEAGVPEYWIVDPDRRHVRIVRNGRDDLLTDSELAWQPAGTTRALMVPVAALFSKPDSR